MLVIMGASSERKGSDKDLCQWTNTKQEEVSMKRKLLALICTVSILLTGCGNKLVNPSEDYVISCLKTVNGVTDIEAATETHDPNGNLHKKGGYTAAIYFRVEQIEITKEEDEWEESGYAYYLNINGNKEYLLLDEGQDIKSPVDVGTQGGGQIEVYASAKEAKDRDDYLGAFDGSAFTSGYHTVVGSMVIRTSEYLTASQQQQLADDVINALKNG